ncbi:ribokinase [Staphylococcus simiae]|uniref:Ribokinase n=1 Tax=Staphylococcus simiae CCM 7213 = CCUG 51256 TaxID=911238 RepID=G5JJR3_9STAP|nr:ribokinase [Staphylococcus simiae]EHJ07570.1 ribokinase family sugar kinase [Staphylococcus simiae CCM 7213 = CCUG 51256]PNZ14684.1 ribokinase [Staphylococcus simiae]SNV55201.1 putative ribokinase [Staphylococcus simiae]
MENEILTFGSINQDIFIKTSDYPNQGDTVWVKDIEYQPGGKGANQAIALARLGCNVKFIGAVGDDTSGNNMISNLKFSGVDTKYVSKVSEVRTGNFIVILDKSAENTMLGTLGANKYIDKQQLEKAFEEVKSRYFLLQLETNSSAIEYSLKLAREKNMIVILDPAPVDGYKEKYLKYVDIITPNQQEAEKISGIKVNDKESAIQAAHIIYKKGVGNVIVKLGKQGSIFYDGNKSTFIPAYKVNAVNTVGAGDVFVAALTSYLSLHNNECMEEAIKYATAASAIKVSGRKTQSAIPTDEEVLKFIKNYTL